MEKSLHTLTLGRGSNPFLRNIFKVDVFILEIARSSGLARIIFNLHLKGKKYWDELFFTCFAFLIHVKLGVLV